MSQPSKEPGAFSVALGKLPDAGQAAHEFEGLPQRTHWAVIGVSITDFTSFLTACGGAQGDELLGFLADTLFEARKAVGQPEDFLAYLGRSDFLIITTPEAASCFQDEILRLFDAGMNHFYSPKDLDRGFLEIYSEHDEFQRFPLVSLAFGLVTDEDGSFTKRLEIYEALIEVRRKAEREMLSLELGSLTARKSHLNERLEVLESDVELAMLIDEFAFLATGTIHDLRNGLNILYQDAYGISPQEAISLADNLRYSRILLENLSEIRFKGEYNPKVLQLESLLSDVQRLLESRGGTCTIRALQNTAPSPVIYADEAQLQQALVGLLKWLSERLDVSSEITLSVCTQANCAVIEVIIETWPEEWNLAPTWPAEYLRASGDPRPYIACKIWQRHGGSVSAKPETKRITLKLSAYQHEDLVSTAEMQRQIAVLKEEVQMLARKVETLEKALEALPLSVERAASLGASTAYKLSRELEVFRHEAEQALSPVGEPAHPMWETIVRNCDYCQLLVMNLLALGQGEDRVFGPIALAPILEDVAAILTNKTRPVAELEWDIEPALDPAKGEETVLKQIFMNLIINALEAVSSNPDLPGLVKVSAGNVKEWVQVEITDNGCGIPPANLEKIFDLHFTTKRQRDRGIGLYIVKSLVERLGGHMEIQTQLAEGITACVRLPRWPTVLLVDDDADWLRVCSKRLAQTHYTLKMSNSVESALRLLSAETFAVVVADIHMPGASGGLGGFEVLSKIKTLSPETQVVLITAYAGGLRDIVREALRRGAHNFVKKPVDFRELDDCIMQAIDYWEQMRGIRKLFEEKSDSEDVSLRALSAFPGETRKRIHGDIRPEEFQVKATAQIFLSYAREDEQRVEKLYQELADAGFKPWMDKKDILPGEKWKSSIREAIQHSDFFMVCLSVNSVDKRGWIQREIKQALDILQEMLESDIYLIPVRLEDCEVPERLRDFQWVDLFEEDGWAWLKKAIQEGIKRRG